MKSYAAVVLCLLPLACSSSPSSDGGMPDATVGGDAGAPDAGTADAGTVDAGPSDAGPSDAGPSDAGPADAGATGLVCGKLIQCDQACTSSEPNCPDQCYAEATANAQSLYDALDDCISGACPFTDGGVCATSDSACSSCESGAATGACLQTLLACEQDMEAGPPNPDGGMTVPDGGTADAGEAQLSCGALVNCEQACAGGNSTCQMNCEDEATSTALMLQQTLNACVAEACPTTDGGPCAEQGTSCTGCEDTAIWSGTCNNQLSACEQDTSGRGDGGVPLEAIDGGVINTLVAGILAPQGITVYGDTVYAVGTQSPGLVVSVPASGGAVPTTLVSGAPTPYSVAVDSSNVYLVSGGSFPGTGLNNGDGTVVQYPLNGSTPVTLGSGLEYAYDAAYLTAVTVDATTVYWVAGASGTDGVVLSTPIGGGTVTTLYSGQAFPTEIASDATYLYWANWGTFQANGDYNGDGAIVKAPKSGGATPTTLASSQLSPLALAIDVNNAYWTTAGSFSNIGLPPNNGGTVAQVPIAGGSVVTLATGLDVPLGIAVDATSVVWVDWALGAPGAVIRVPIGGGAVTTLVSGATNPFGIALSGDSVYWTDSPPNLSNQSSGAVLRLALPTPP